MAARVNTKFVIILVAGLLAVGAAAITTFVLVVKKTGEDYIRLGDEAAAAGNWKEAQRLYGSAVFKDRTNPVWMQTWFDALGNVVPEDANEYDQRYTEYVAAAESLARLNRGDIEASERYLKMLHDQLWLLYGAPPQLVDNLADEADQLFAFFQSDPSGEWNRLRRYKGLGYVRLLNAGRPLQEDDRETAIAELRAVLEVAPQDAEAATALVQIIENEARSAILAGDSRTAGEQWQAADDVLARLRRVAPNDYFTRMFDIIVPVGRLRLDPQIRALPGPTQAARIRELSAEPIANLKSLLREMSRENDPLPFDLVARARAMELALDPISQGTQTSAIIARQLEIAEQNPEAGVLQSRIYRLGAELLAGQSEFEKAIAYLDELEALDYLPLSVQGRIRLGTQQTAPALTARIAGIWASTLDDDADAREKALQITADARDRFRRVAGDESEQLLLIDAIVAEVLGDFRDALDNYAKYNEVTQDSDVLAVRREALVAAQLGRFAQARTKFEQLLRRNQFDAETLKALARVDVRIGETVNLQQALNLYSRAAEVEPDAEARAEINREITRLRERLGQVQADDPVLEAIFEAERIAEGEGETGGVGDPVRAIRVLQDAVETSGYDPRAVVALANKLIQRPDGLEGIKSLIGTAQSRRPDDEAIARLAPVLEAEERADAVVLVLEQSGIEEYQKLLTQYQIYTVSGREADAEAVLADLTESYPDRPEVLELRFLGALREENAELAQQLAAKAVEIDADNVDGMTFEARLASFEGDEARAADLLSAATRASSVDASVWRLLAISQQRLGQNDLAIESLKQALAVRENNAAVILEYIQALLLGEQLQEALVEARRLLPYGERDPRFRDLYLNLETQIGGEQGLKIAIDRRFRRYELTPEDLDNAVALASLYVRDGQLDAAEELLATLVEENEQSLRLVVLQASIFAVQGTVETPAGPRRGIDLARGAFIDYIIGLQTEEEISEAYQTMARFMYARNQNEIALRAIEEARAIQDEETRPADRLAGDIFSALQRHDEAAEAYELVVNNGADDEQLTYRRRLIDAYNRGRRYDDALAELAKPGVEDGLGVIGLTQRADSLMGLGRREEAVRAIGDALTLDPENPLIFLRRAEILAADPQYTREVLDDVDEAIRLDPEDWRGHRLRAAILTRLDRRDEAIRSLREVVRLNPRLNDAVVGLMSELITDGRDGEALEVINNVLAERRGDTLLILASAQVFVDRNLWGRAAELYSRAWAQTSDIGVGLRYIDALLNVTPARPGDAEVVIEEMRNTGIAVDEISEILISRALIENAQNRPRRAEALIAQAFDNLQLSTQTVLNWSGNVGRLHRDRQPGAAAAFIDTQLERVRSPERQAWLNIVKAGMLIENDATSSQGEELLAATAEQQDFPEVALLAARSLAINLYARGRIEEAVDRWKKLLERFGDEWETANNLGYALAIDLGRPEEGLPYVRRALVLNPEAAIIANSLARVYIELGQLDDAEDMLDRSEAMSGDIGARITTQLHKVRLNIARGNMTEAERLLAVAETAVGQIRGDGDSFREEIEGLRSQIQGG
ncbi:MAG: tetratricopeptide repeat protein [Planctomycetota bacterium]